MVLKQVLMGQTLRISLFFLGVLCLAAELATAATDGPVNSTADQVRSQLSRYAALGDIPLPDLTDDDIAAMLDGEPVVRMSSRTSSGSVSEFGVVGIHVIDSPKLLVWLTAMGVASEPDVRLTRAMLTEPEGGEYVRYQHVNLPWPVRDRHWVIHCEKDVSLAEASDGEFWKHRWVLVEQGESLLPDAIEDGRISGLSRRKLDKAVYLPANKGAWITASINEEQTLVIAYFDGSLGGLFPDAVVRRFAKVHLRGGLKLVGELSATAHQEYADSRTIYDGFGQPISRDAVLKVASDLRPGDHPVTTD